MSKKDVTEAAKEIRRVLKSTYPDTKFSVRVSRFSGGSSVEIEWTNGPTQSDVEKLTEPYKGYGNSYYNEYINTNRHISVEAMEAATKAAAECYGIPTPQVKVCTGNPYLDDMTVVDGEPICDVVHRAVHATSLYGISCEAFSDVFQSNGNDGEQENEPEVDATQDAQEPEPTTKIFDDLQDRLMDIAQEMTGEKRDSRFKSWAKTVDSVNVKASNGYAFVGDWINEGTVEMELKPCLFLVHFNHGSRKYSTGEYAVVAMDENGELYPTDIMTDNRKPGWALRIRDQVASALDDFNDPSPRYMSQYEIFMVTLRERFPAMTDDEIVVAALNVFEQHTRR